MRHKPSVMLATWFGSGLIPPILTSGWAGTWGTIASLPLCCLVLWLAGTRSTFGGLLILGAVLLVILTLSVLVVPQASASLESWIRRYRPSRPEKKIVFDQFEIVIDEVLGMLVTIWPMIVWQPDMWLLVLIIGFVLFRIFDGLKLWPSSYWDNQQGVYGVMLDDFFAGIYASFVLIPVVLFM